MRYGVAMVPRPDRSPLGELLREHDPMMRALAYRLVGPGNVDDVLQDAYLRAVRSYATFRGDSAFRTWLYRIVHNTCVDRIRHDQRQPSIAMAEEQTINDFTADHHRFGSDPASDLEVEQALSELGEDQRVAVILVGVVGLSYDEAAEVLDVPRGTVATRVHRGRTELKRALRAEVA